MDRIAKLTAQLPSLRAIAEQSAQNHTDNPTPNRAARAASDMANVWALEARIRRLSALAA